MQNICWTREGYDVGGSKHLRNFRQFLPDVTTSQKTDIFILANVRTRNLNKWENNIKIDLKILRMEGECKWLSLRAPIPVAERSKA
jgi:hypothetical protein